jgi:CubicO group peptidase (beta-lactamase class C family)
MLTLMLTDHLTTGQRSEASPLLDGKGWGFGLSVEPGCLPQAALSGRVGWAGGAGTSWSSDLGQDKAVVVFSNRALDAPEVYAGHQTIHRAILG